MRQQLQQLLQQELHEFWHGQQSVTGQAGQGIACWHGHGHGVATGQHGVAIGQAQGHDNCEHGQAAKLD